MFSREVYQIAQQIESLSFKDKVWLIEEIARMLRRPTPEEEATMQAQLNAMAVELNRIQDEENENNRREAATNETMSPP